MSGLGRAWGQECRGPAAPSSAALAWRVYDRRMRSWAFSLVLAAACFDDAPPAATSCPSYLADVRACMDAADLGTEQHCLASHEGHRDERADALDACITDLCSALAAAETSCGDLVSADEIFGLCALQQVESEPYLPDCVVAPPYVCIEAVQACYD